MGIPEAKIRASAAKANVQQSKSPLISFLKPLIHKRNKRRKADAEIVELADSLQRKVALQIKDCGRVVSFSGCADNQRSVDVFSRAATTAYGAMTHAFVTAIHSAELGTPECTFLSMLESMKEALRRGGHIQVPQLCCSHENILQAKFEL
jgi:Caspase domain